MKIWIDVFLLHPSDIVYIYIYIYIYHISGSTKRSTPVSFLQVQTNVRSVNTSRQRQNGRHFADDIFKCIFLNENLWISIKISLKFVPKGPINNIPALVQIMAWCRPGDKLLSEAMLVNLPTHICVSRPQWVNCVANSLHHTINIWEHVLPRRLKESFYAISWPIQCVSESFMVMLEYWI